MMYLSTTLITAAVSLTLMFSLDVRLTLLALIPLPLVSIAVKLFGSAIHETFEHVQEKLSDMSAVVQESLTGVRVVRAYRQALHDERVVRLMDIPEAKRLELLIRVDAEGRRRRLESALRLIPLGPGQLRSLREDMEAQRSRAQSDFEGSLNMYRRSRQ